MKIKWTEEKKREIVKRCDSAKENGEKCGDILKEYGLASSMLCQWRKKYGKKRKGIPSEIIEQFEGVKVDPLDFSKAQPETSQQIIIDDYDHCCAVVVALVMSGYTVSQEVKDRNHFINYK